MFVRKLTSLIEKMSVTNEGQQAPQTVEVLKRMDIEIAALKKEIKALKAS